MSRQRQGPVQQERYAVGGEGAVGKDQLDGWEINIVAWWFVIARVRRLHSTADRARHGREPRAIECAETDTWSVGRAYSEHAQWSGASTERGDGQHADRLADARRLCDRRHWRSGWRMGVGRRRWRTAAPARRDGYAND